MEPLAISISEAIRITGLGRTNLYKHIADQSLQTIKIGRRRLVRTSSIKSFLGETEAQ